MTPLLLTMVQTLKQPNNIERYNFSQVLMDLAVFYTLPCKAFYYTGTKFPIYKKDLAIM